LQAYALQVVLQRMGCEVETLDRRSSRRTYSALKYYLIDLVRLSLGRIKSIPSKRKYDFVYERLLEFRKREINLSSEISTEREIRRYFRSRTFDVVLVGSDQVWRPRYSPNIYNYYLDFLEDVDNSSLRLSYAASFGVDEWEYNATQTRICRNLISKFDMVSVREESAEELCARYLGVPDVSRVVDPTLLLDVSDYEKLINGNATKKYSGVLAYILDQHVTKMNIIDRVTALLDIEAFSVKPDHDIKRSRSSELEHCRYPSVEDWLRSFRDADFVVTDSFHGCIFSIVFNKPFIALGNATRGLSRITSLLDMFGLQSRLVKQLDNIDPEIVLTPIDWERVNSIRSLRSAESMEFLASGITIASEQL